MKKTMTVLAITTALGLAGASGAFAMDEELSMLETAVAQALEAQGIDASNIGSLTLSEVAEIKGLLEGGSMSGVARTRIEEMLSN